MSNTDRSERDEHLANADAADFIAEMMAATGAQTFAELLAGWPAPAEPEDR